MVHRWLGAAACVVALLAAQGLARADSYNGHALTPPMGYNTWNAFGCNINEDLIKQTALALHANGMQDAGYRYVNLDDCWQSGRDVTGNNDLKRLVGRSADGHLIADPKYFPNGIKTLADYVHALGLKFGLYSSNGTGTCQNVAGTLGHEKTDAEDYAALGVDYFKLDTCNSGLPADPKSFYTRYKVFSDALLQTGRDIVFSICDFTQGGQTWQWGAEIGNLWRTTGDISANFNSMLNNFTSNQTRATYAGPGHWNDPDMLEIGTGSFSTLAAPARVGDTTVQVASASNAIAGSALHIGTAAGGDLDSYIVSSVGTAAGAATSLFAPAAAGDTNVKVGSTSGFTVGNKLLLDTDGTYESPTITSVGTAGTSTALADTADAGDGRIRVAATANVDPGDTLTVDDETAKVDSVGTAAGPATTLAAPVSAGATSIKVASMSGFTTGEPVLLDSGSSLERATVTSVGTAAGPATTTAAPVSAGDTNVKLAGTATTLSAATAAGDTNVKVASVTNLVAGNQLTIDGAGAQETVTIANVGTAGATGTGLTVTPALANAHASGVPATTIAGYKVGDPFAIDTGAGAETGTVTGIGTAAGPATTTVAPTAVGDTNVKVTSTAGMVVGHDVVMYEQGLLPLGTAIETARITGIGTAAGAQTTTAAPAAAGDTNVKVASTAGFAVGDPMQIKDANGANFETATVAAIGSAAGASTTLAKAAAAGDTNVKVTSTAGFNVGEQMAVGVGRAEEVATVTDVGTAGADGTGITLATPLQKDHLILILIRGLGTGITLSAPLQHAHASGSATRGQGTGITVTPLTAAHPLATTGGSPGQGITIRDLGTGITVTPLAHSHTVAVPSRGLGTGVGVTALSGAHPDGAAARDTGTGITLTAPLSGTHAAGATVRDQSKPGTGVTFSPALSSAHPINAVTRGGGTGIALAAPIAKPHANGTAIGKSGMSLTESQTHFSLWAMAAAPLLAGTDVVNIAKENLAIYLNKDVIAIDQDPLGVQATTVSNLNGQWKLARPLADGDRAVALFNAGASDWALASADFASLGLESGTTYLTKDLWSKDITMLADPLSVAFLPSHATKIYRISKRPPTVTVPAVVQAQSPGANGTTVSFDVSARDALDGALQPTCSQASGTLFPIGPTTVTCSATDLAGRTSTSAFVVQVLPPGHPLDVGGTVPATLTLTLGPAASFGTFTPGVDKDYTAHTTATVISTAGDATVSVSDPGHLTNGAFTLPSPLQVLGLPKLYAGPVSNDVVPIDFKQHIGATDALRTGAYSTTLTFTLTTTTP